MNNQTLMQYFEWNLPADGLLWQRTAAQAAALKKAGFTALWLPPAYKGAAGVHDVGYGVYDTYDLGEFDQKGTVPTKYGTKQEYLAAIKALQAQGIAVLADIVLGQRIGADETELVEAEKFNPNNRNQSISGEQQIKAWTRYNFPGRAGKYSGFVWDWTCFSGIDWDENTRQSGVYQFAGKEWSPDVDKELGNYDYLMGADVDVDNPKVAQELIEWGKWYLDLTGIDGFRLDAVKHISYAFYEKWLDAMRAKAGKNLFTVGEYWSGDLNALTAYLANSGDRMSLFDVPLHMNFHNASTAGGQFGMQGLLQNSLASADAMHAVTFVDNHDSQPGQSLQSWVEEWFKPLAYAVVLLRQQGVPCVFYGDYYGLRSDGTPAVPGIKRMVAARHHFAYGPQHDYFDHDNIVGWTREGDAEHPGSGCAVLITDGPGGEKTMYVGRQFAGQVFRDIIRLDEQAVTIDADGNGTFSVEGGAASVWLPEEAYKAIIIEVE
ncbi:alpha-amylase [Ruminococcaceae bacterium OttesenSCG-928-A16]|nr:alpha-amylase [Ruminococcaceae bacterium OttesenSCG-928-A16]